jgi:HK97 family phage portal protein
MRFSHAGWRCGPRMDAVARVPAQAIRNQDAGHKQRLGPYRFRASDRVLHLCHSRDRLAFPIVRGAIAILSETIGQLLFTYEVAADGSKTRATSHPLYALLHDQPNDFTSSYEFRRDLQTDLLLWGNGFAHLGRSRATGQIVELIRIPPSAVTLDENDAGEPLYFVTDKAGTRRKVDRGDILHITAAGRRSPIDACREAIGVAMAMEAHQAKLFANGYRPAGMLRLKGRIAPAMLERLQADFQQKWAGLSGSGRTMILEDDAAYEPVQFSSTDAQLLDLRRFQVSEIARAFRIPPHMLADLERTTHHNAEEMGSQFLQLSLLPHIVSWEQAMRRALLTPAERERYSIEFSHRWHCPRRPRSALRGLF